MILVQTGAFKVSHFAQYFRRRWRNLIDSPRDRFIRQTRRPTTFLSGACPDKVVRGQFSVMSNSRNPPIESPFPRRGILIRASPQPDRRSEWEEHMHRADLLKPDLLSEILLLGTGALILVSVLLVTVTALARP